MMFSKFARGLLQTGFKQPVRPLSTSSWSQRKKNVITALGVITGSITVFLITLDRAVRASDLEIAAPTLPWYHSGALRSLDHASLRRGLEIYRNICSACHSLQYVAFRDLVGVTHTEEQAKSLAEEYMIKDGPNEEGEMFTRPGRLSDYFPSPYPNEEAARFANNGAFPPDLTYMSVARKQVENYIFHLLTGYTDAPAGITLREGQNFNPYFMGGALAMAAPLYDDAVEYSDGTPAYRSQLAKDVSEFLTWTADNYFNERKIMLIESLVYFAIITPVVLYYKGHKWSVIKSRKYMKWPPKDKAK